MGNRRKVKYGSLKEIYGRSNEVLEAKIIPALEEPRDESSQKVKLNMGSHGSERSDGRHCSSSKLDMKEESRTCKVYVSTGSSCMHCECVASLRVTKADEFSNKESLRGTKADEFSDKVCVGKGSSRHSSNEAGLSSPSMNNACNGKHHTGNYTSNLLNACSSNGSFSENSATKATLTALNSCEDVIYADQIVSNNCGLSEARILCDNRIFSNQLEKPKESDCLGDTISCISSSHCMDMMVHDHNDDRGRKNQSHGLASVNCVPAVELAGDEQPASCWGNDRFDQVDNNRSRKSDKFTKESSLGIAVCSNKSDLSEISSLRDSYLVASSPKCSDDQVESSVARAATIGIGGQMHRVHNYAKSMQPGTEMNKRELPEKCFDQKEHFERSIAAVGKPNLQELPLQSQSVNPSDRSDVLNDEVKACSVCGDVGCQQSLAVCSKRNDGAEHIYCTRVVLEKVPDGNWMCKEYMLAEEAEKQKKNKLETGAGILKISSSNAIRQDSQNSSAFDNKNSLKFDKKVSSIEKSRTNKVSSTCHFSAKRPVGCLEAVSVEKRRDFEKIAKPLRVSRLCSQTSLCQDSSVQNLDEGKIKAAHVTSSGGKSPKLSKLGDGSPNCSLENARMPSVSRGSLFKSRSFNNADLGEKFQQSREYGVKKQKFSSEGSNSDGRKVGVAQMICKSVPFSIVGSGHLICSNSEVQTLSSNLCLVDNLKKSRREEEQNVTEKNNKFKSDDLSVSMPVGDDGVSATVTRIMHSNNHCLEPVEVHGKPSNPSNFSHHLEQGGFPNEEQGRVTDDVRQHIGYCREAAFSTHGNHSNVVIPPNGRPYVRKLPLLASSVDIRSWISAIPQLDCIWQGGFEIQRSARLPSFWDGIQAHLSSCASLKVVEVANKLPQKILLEEVPRLSAWPIQFSKNHATEDNIVLYFFAKDLESYQRNYKSSLECMSNNDLCLKGNLGGIELLIFSSNMLPQKTQYWNGSFFLWGVFRGRRVTCPEQMLISREKISISSLNVSPLQQDMSTPTIYGLQSLFSSGQSSVSNISYDVQHQTLLAGLTHPLLLPVEASKQISTNN